MYIIYIWISSTDSGINTTRILASRKLYQNLYDHCDDCAYLIWPPLHEEGCQVCITYCILSRLLLQLVLFLQSRVKSKWPLFLSKIINLVPWCSMGLKHSISRPQDQIPSKFGLYPDPIHAILNELKYSFFSVPNYLTIILHL